MSGGIHPVLDPWMSQKQNVALWVGSSKRISTYFAVFSKVLIEILTSIGGNQFPNTVYQKLEHLFLGRAIERQIRLLGWALQVLKAALWSCNVGILASQVSEVQISGRLPPGGGGEDDDDVSKLLVHDFKHKYMTEKHVLIGFETWDVLTSNI